MHLCPKCENSPIPFLMVLLVSSFSAFLTWLTLGFSQVGEMEQILGSGFIFFGVGATLTHYVLSCMKRHCRHDTFSHGRHQEATH